MFLKLQKIEIKSPVKKMHKSCDFFHSLYVGIKVAQGVGGEGLCSLAWVSHCGNMEICKWQVKNGVNVSRNRQSHHFFTFSVGV